MTEKATAAKATFVSKSKIRLEACVREVRGKDAETKVLITLNEILLNF